MLYAAKSYWPGVAQLEIEQVGRRTGEVGAARAGVAYLGSLLFSDDDLVLCLFEGASRAAVKRVSEMAGIPCERLMPYMWVDGGRPSPKGARR